MIISNDGTMIRMSVSDINVYSRNTQGIILMRLAEGVSVISAARTEKTGDEEADSQERQTGSSTEGN
jgi:DNA gyrase subunit A